MLMRHARAESGKVGLSRLHPEGKQEVSEVGEALAFLLSDYSQAGKPFEIRRVLVEDSPACFATAQALVEAYNTTRRQLGCRGTDMPRLPRLEVLGLSVSAYVPVGSPKRRKAARTAHAGIEPISRKQWLESTKDEMHVTNDHEITPGSAVLLIGHDPGMSWLLDSLLKGTRRRHSFMVPGLARSELIALRGNGRHWIPSWALTPSAAVEQEIEKLTSKISSKMDTAKVFGAFVTALLTFIATQYALYPIRNPTASDSIWIILRTVSLGSLGTAVILYLLTLFWYDRLIMPRRFWRSGQGGRRRLPSGFLERPPSSAVWVLYQNMQRTWRLLFVPASWAAGIGVGTFVVARTEPSDLSWLPVLSGLALAVLTVCWGWLSRPTLGVED